MALTKVTFSMTEGQSTNVVDFGAVGDGVANDAPAIQAAIDYLYAQTLATGLRSRLVFPSGVYLCNSTLTFKPFINYQGVRATTASGTSSTSASNQGAVLWSGETIYTDNNATEGVLVYVPTGDITIRDLLFVGTATRNLNPSCGIQWSSSGGTRPQENGQTVSYTSGIDIQNCSFVAFKTAWECYGSAGYARLMQFESNVKAVASKDSSTPTHGNYWEFTDCTFDTSVITFDLTNTIANRFVVIGGGIAGNPGVASTGVDAAGAVPLQLTFNSVEFSNFNYGSGYALNIDTTTDTTATTIKSIGCIYTATCDQISISRGSGGTASNKNVAFIGNTIDCPINLTIVYGTQISGNLISKPITINTAGAFTQIIGNKFSNVTGAPVVVPADSSNFVMIGNEFVGCATPPSLTSHPTNIDWDVHSNTGVAGQFVQYRYEAVATPTDVNVTYVSNADGKLYFRDSGGTSHALY